MKNKSQRHRESNTFRFQSFHERIKNVKVSCRKYLLYSGTVDSSNESELFGTLSKFEELNLSEKFMHFRTGFGVDVRTLPQVLHFEEKIASVLKNHISISNEYSYCAILSCISAFALDISELFYKKHYFKFLPLIHDKLDVTNNENIEHTFVCYASLFTILGKYLKYDIDQVLYDGNYIQYFTKSYPWYINELAAKSLCFIIRQLPKKKQFFIRLFKYFEEKGDSYGGIGALICASFQLDISNRLHSSTGHLLNVLFEILKEPDTPREAGHLAIMGAFKSLVSHVTTNKSNSIGDWNETWVVDSEYVWPVIIKHFQSAANNDESVDSDFVLTIITVAGVLLDYKNCQLLINQQQLIDATIYILRYKYIDEVGMDVLLIFKRILSSRNQQISDESCKSIFVSIFNSSICYDTVFSLVEGLFTDSHFDAIIYHLFLDYCMSLLPSSKDQEKSVIEILANLAVIKSPSVRSAEELNSVKPYQIDLSECENHTKLFAAIQQRKTLINSDLSNIEEISTIIILFGHIKPFKKEKYVLYMKKIFKQIVSMLTGNFTKNSKKRMKVESPVEKISDAESIEKLIFTLSLITEMLHNILSKEEFVDKFHPLSDVLLIIEKNPFLKENHNYLRMLDIICHALSIEKSSCLTLEKCEKLYNYLNTCLSSTKSLVRMLSASVFSSFPCSRPAESDSDFDGIENMFDIMVKAESIPPHPSHFKERLRLLRVLVEDSDVYKPIIETFELASLKFMIGQLTIDYKDLWGPVMNGISTYARSLSIDKFWSLWHAELQNAAELSLLQLRKKRSHVIQFKPDVPALQNLLDIQSIHDSTKHLTQRSSALDFRDHLWTVMLQFPDICEKKNEHLVKLFFDFIENEVSPSNRKVSHFQDISKYDVIQEQIDDEMEADVEQKCHENDIDSKEDYLNMDEEDSEISINLNADENTCLDKNVVKHIPEDIQMKEDDENDADSEEDADNDLDFEDDDKNDIDSEDNCEMKDSTHQKKYFRRAPIKTVNKHIAIFSKFSNMKRIYRSQDMEKLLLRFLYHPIESINKQALATLFAYNHQHIVSYKVFLHSLLEDKKSLNRVLTLFSVDGNGVDDARSLKPCHEEGLMEVLLRILYGKMNSRSKGGKKIKHSHKQITIVRFLGSLKPKYIRAFVDLLFDGIIKDFEGDSFDVLQNVKNNFNPKRVVPLKRLKGFLNTVNLVIEQFGSLLSGCCDEVLKVTLFVLNIATVGVDNGHGIADHYVTKLKQIRQLSTRRLILFFKTYDEYKLSDEEKNAIFHCINPQISALMKDCLWTSNIVMKLFICWSENPHYHEMLATCLGPENKNPPIKYIMDVLQHPRCMEAVIKDILGLVFNLLFEKSTTDISGKPEILPIIKHAKDNGYPNLTIGEAMVYMYSDSILASIRKRLVDKSFSNQELMILLHICEWMTRRQSAVQLIKVIIPILENKQLPEERAIYLLNVCVKLIYLIDRPDRHLHKFLEMFVVFQSRHVRAALCRVIDTVAVCNEKFVTISIWCNDLHSYDPNKIEDEDLTRRHSCYKNINNYLKTCDDIDQSFFLCILTNCYHVIESVDVVSLVELSSQSIENCLIMFARLCNIKYPIRKSLLNNCLRKIRALLKNQSERVQTIAWNLLRSAVIYCHNDNKQLMDLKKLYDEDDEKDFFSNIVHTQLHRRSRVLVKLSENLCSGELSLLTDNIVSYLMSAVTTYLFKDEYSKNEPLVLAAISCLGAFAKCLPWQNYQSLLRNYLKVMDRDLKYLKQGVRALEAVIDAFHEDFSKFADKSESVAFQENMEVDSRNDNASYSCLVHDLIPKMQVVFASRNTSEAVHKLNKKAFPEDDDIKKVSLGLTLIKLFKKLPNYIMNSNARNITLRLIQFLSSKAESIRKQAREMLVKVMKEIGPSHLTVCVKDMNSLLERGYQRHVCVFTLYEILNHLAEDMEPKYIDDSVSQIVDICIEDLFGGLSEEKEVSKIVLKCKEARAGKGDAILGFISMWLGQNNLLTLMKPFYDIAQTSSDKGTMNKVAHCLTRISRGLSENTHIDLQNKSLFIFTLYNEKIDDLFSKKKVNKPKVNTVRDCLLLVPEPKVIRVQAKVSKKSTSHVFVEFALDLLHCLIKHKKYLKTEKIHLELLDSFIPQLNSSLLSEYPQICIHTLHLIDRLMLYPLPSMKEHMPRMCKQMFVVLDQFSTYNLPSGKNYNMLQCIFHTLSMVLNNATDVEFETDHLKVLVYYARDNLPKTGETHSIFLLVKAMLFRKINVLEFHNLMKKIKLLSIESDNVTMLDQARSAYFYYLMNYPKLSSEHVGAILFYAGNMGYERALGKMSAILMMERILTSYPRNFITKSLDSGIFLRLSEEHYRAASSQVKLLLAKCINIHFKLCERKETLLNICFKVWKKDDSKSVHDRAVWIGVIAQSLQHMIDLPNTDIPKIVFRKVLPRTIALLNPKKYTHKSLSETDRPLVYVSIHSLLQLLRILCSKYLSENTVSEWNTVVSDDIYNFVRHYLSHSIREIKSEAAIINNHFNSIESIREKI